MPVDIRVQEQATEEALFVVIIIQLFLKKIKAGMPIFIALVGKSSSGKSFFGMLIQDILYRAIGEDYVTHLKRSMLLKPDKIVPQVKEILDGKIDNSKKTFTLQTDEAKFIIGSQHWNSFRNKAIRTITATSRSIKPMIFIVVAQLMRDIDKSTRLSLDYYFEIKRSPQGRPTIVPFVLYEDTSDLEKVKVKKRRLRIGIQHKNGSVSEVLPVFRPEMPRKEVIDAYKSFEVGTKKEEIFKLLDELDKDAKKISGDYESEIKDFANYLLENPAELEKLGRYKNGKWVVSKDTQIKYNYTANQFKQIEKFISEKAQDYNDDKEVLENE